VIDISFDLFFMIMVGDFVLPHPPTPTSGGGGAALCIPNEQLFFQFLHLFLPNKIMLIVACSSSLRHPSSPSPSGEEAVLCIFTE
jgi:hypothetical protein